MNLSISFVVGIFPLLLWIYVVQSQNTTNSTTISTTTPTVSYASTVPPTPFCSNICPSKIKLARWNYPPYTNYKDLNGNLVEGLFEWLIKLLVKRCCGTCTTLSYWEEKTRHEELNDVVGSMLKSNESRLGAIYFPVYGNMKKIKFQDRHLYPVVAAPGVVYFEEVGKNDNSALSILSKLVGGWPVLVLTIIMAAVSGILMWAMDSYYNPAEFPSTFFKGSWEGFWWAFITMTTVGYGDISPKSVYGRVFSFFWILIGLTIISIFTATVTSALTEMSLKKEVSLYGKHMVVYNLTEEHRYGVKGNAKVYPVENVIDFVKKIKEGFQGVSVDGGLLDNYVAGFHENDISKSEFQTPKVFDYSYSYGFLTDGALEDQAVVDCFRRVLSENDTDIESYIKKNFKVYVEPASATQSSNGFNLFNSESQVFKGAVFACLGLIFILILLAIAWEYFYWHPKQKRLHPKKKEELRTPSPFSSYGEMITTQCDELQQAMYEEMIVFNKSFHTKVEKIKRERVSEIEEDDEVRSVTLDI